MKYFFGQSWVAYKSQSNLLKTQSLNSLSLSLKMMSINANTKANAKSKASSRKLNVVTVVEQTQVNTADALVEQLMETTTAHIQNFTLDSTVPVVAVPVKRARATRAKVTDVDSEVTDVADAVVNKRKSKKSPAPADVTDVADAVSVAVVNKRKSKKSPAPADVTDVAAETDAVSVAVVNKRKSKKSPAPADVTDVAAETDAVSVAVVNKRKPKKSPSPAERKPKSKAVIEPFTPSTSPFMPNTPSHSATHNDVEVEEVSVDGVLYYKDADGNLYDHATFEPITK